MSFVFGIGPFFFLFSHWSFLFFFFLIGPFFFFFLIGPFFFLFSHWSFLFFFFLIGPFFLSCFFSECLSFSLFSDRPGALCDSNGHDAFSHVLSKARSMRGGRDTLQRVPANTAKGAVRVRVG